MITAISHVACRVRDLEASLRFYRDVLGLAESYRLSHESGDTMLVALWLGGESFLELVPAATDAGAPSWPGLGYQHPRRLGRRHRGDAQAVAGGRAGQRRDAGARRRRRLELLDSGPGWQSDRALAEPARVAPVARHGRAVNCAGRSDSSSRPDTPTRIRASP
jgi:catechol 2,3-dioxygenase-like lactoylglutathione lyase family enzyme